MKVGSGKLTWVEHCMVVIDSTIQERVTANFGMGSLMFLRTAWLGVPQALPSPQKPWPESWLRGAYGRFPFCLGVGIPLKNPPWGGLGPNKAPWGALLWKIP